MKTRFEQLQLAETRISQQDALLHRAADRLKKFGFVCVLSGDTGFKHIECRECRGANDVPDRHNLNIDQVRHSPDCPLAALIRELEQT